MCSNCSCWMQDEAVSIGPAEGVGAPSITGKSGGLVSTFAIWNSSYYAPAASVFCPAETRYAYCWGAYCHEDPNKKGMATCQCPMNVNPLGDVPTRVFIQ